jgi:hypothetical protein
MKLRSGGYCLIRSKHVCLTKDEPDGQGRFCVVSAPLAPGDHHWLTLVCDLWDSEEDCKAGRPPVLRVDPQFGHRFILDPVRDVGGDILAVIDSHYKGGRRGPILDPARHPTKAVADTLGLLAHPHVQALEVTP